MGWYKSRKISDTTPKNQWIQACLTFKELAKIAACITIYFY